MVKISGTQNIPSELFGLYKQALTELGANDFCKKRSPFRLPNMQNSGIHVRQNQLNQRAIFIQAIALFNTEDQASRQRWYARMPEWSSLLWYYNYYIMDAISAAITLGGGVEAVINSIQILSDTVPITGGKDFTIDSVDPTRTVVMIFGNSYISDKVQRGDNTVNQNSTVTIGLSPNVDPAIAEVKIQGQHGYADPGGEGEWLTPYVDSLSATQLIVALQASGFVADCNFSWEVIERKAQTVFPIPTNITATKVSVDWAIVPSVAAEVSIIVVEYI